MASEKSGQELRRLVQSMHTRSPQEVMGQAATSSLIGSVTTAAISLLGILVLATVLMFLLIGPPATRDNSNSESVAKFNPANSEILADEATDLNNTTDSLANVSSTADATNPDPQGQVAIEAMGIGETKDAGATPDSLEDRMDDLLKGLE